MGPSSSTTSGWIGAYNYLLCLGDLSRRRSCTLAWRKGVVSEGGVGTLVRMAEGQSTTHKITKKLADMKPIEELPCWVRNEVMSSDEQSV